MSAHIHSWIDGYAAVRARAYETRGAIELDTGARWPRTTGEDVIAIAALFDGAIRVHGTPGIVRRWRATLDQLETGALVRDQCRLDAFRLSCGPRCAHGSSPSHL